MKVNGTEELRFYTDVALSSIASATNPLLFETGGSERMRIDSAGNVGIGTSSPGAKLELYSAGTLNLRLNGSLVGGNTVDFYNYIPAVSNDGFSIDIGGTNRLSMTNSGNLGLGVTPSAWGVGKAFEVGALGNALWGVSANDVRIMQNAYYSDAERYASSTTASMYRQASGIHQWFTAPSGTAGDAISFTQAMTLGANGNLAVGDTSTGNARLFSYISDASLAAINARQDGAGPIQVWNSGGTERARIDSSGRLLVGTTSNVSGEILNATQTTTNTALFVNLNAASTTASSAISVRKFDNDNTTSQIYMEFAYNAGGNGAGGIQGNGSSGVQFYSSSDARLKENVKPLESQLANIMALKPSKFDYIDGPKDCTGFIAQEMEQVYPDTVGETADGYKTIGGISTMEARLIKAIQEQQAIIESLKARLDAANL
jgi:hypothetical protein